MSWHCFKQKKISNIFLYFLIFFFFRLCYFEYIHRIMTGKQPRLKLFVMTYCYECDNYAFLYKLSHQYNRGRSFKELWTSVILSEITRKSLSMQISVKLTLQGAMEIGISNQSIRLAKDFISELLRQLQVRKLHEFINQFFTVNF